jgi:hypothetical protein
VDVVGFAVELDQLGVEFGAHATHGVLGEGEHRVGEHRAGRYFVTNTWWACSKERLCRARR